MNRLRRFEAILLAPFAVIGSFVFGQYLSSQSLIPDPMAIHWGLNLRADGFLGTESFLFSNLFFQVLFLGALVFLEFSSPRSFLLRPLIQAFASTLFWLIFFLMTAVLLLQVGQSDASKITFPAAIFLAILVLVVVAVWFFIAFPEVQVKDSVVIKLRHRKVMEIPFDQIRSVESGQIKARRYFGYGLRVRGKEIAFIPSSGAGLIIRLKDNEIVAVRSHEPERVVNEILSRLRS